ncbi:MAG: amidophosphoribosyltransferase [Planctomycetota bacterium]|nr:MAG: amidophosphoribosyltransferase [Planctomycetota bacterium]
MGRCAMNHGWREACGIVAFSVPGQRVAPRLLLGLLALQHRGQESAGIAGWEDGRLRLERGMGLVSQALDPERLAAWSADIAVGHVRYATVGESAPAHAQPLVVSSRWGPIAIAHNGTLVGVRSLRAQLAAAGARIETATDTELMAHLVALQPEPRLEDAIAAAMRQLEGAFSVVLLAEGRLYALRDAHAIRPLSLGRLDGGWAVASESCAFDHTGVHDAGEIGPGELCVIERGRLRRRQVLAPVREARCVFEYIYFARPDSVIAGRSVHRVRERMGARLAEQHPVEADLVVPVPDSGLAPALGFARRSGIRFELALVKSRYIGRSFIEAGEKRRAAAVRRKLNVVRELVAGQRVVLVDDSIVRGTTSARIVAIVREAGAREVHLRVASPPIRWPCFYGVDTANRIELIASEARVEEIRLRLGADSLGYLGQDALVDALELERSRLCMACLDGSYPTPVPEAHFGPAGRSDDAEERER